MNKYLFIESRDPFESQDCLALYDLIEGQAKQGSEVTIFLVQNGVLPARQNSHYASRLAALRQDKVTMLADDFSLRERAIRRLADGVRTAKIEELVDLIFNEGTKTIWH